MSIHPASLQFSFIVRSFLTLLSVGLACALSAGAQSSAGSNMLGTQSQNTGLIAVPAKGTVTIDGKLDEWDLSGRMWSFADINLRDEYSVETAAMWGADHLYLALRWRDPNPLNNQIAPRFNPKDGWKGGSVQLRMRTDRLLWLTAWRYAGDGSSNLLLDRWKDASSHRKGMDSAEFLGRPDEVEIGDGIAMAFSATPGGYIQEMRLPWRLLFDTPPDIEAGLKLRSGFEFIWGDVTGKEWPSHRYADNMQPGATDRKFFWTAQNAWGDIELAAEGNLPLRQYRAAGQGIDGPVRVKLSLPKEARRFTVVIEDEEGRRVRNLIADSNPADHAVSSGKDGYVTEIGWDGADDEGKAVTPGTYRVRGLWHEGLDAIYDMTFYNPGTPPWQTQDGSGSWGADHYPPREVIAAGDWMILSWNFAEGGSGLIGVGPDGRKKWGENRGSPVTAANSRHVFSIMSGWHGRGNLCRYDRTTGSYAPFVLGGNPRPFEVPMADIIPDAPEPEQYRGVVNLKDQDAFVRTMAADETRLVLALADGRIAVVDVESAQLLRKLFVGKASSLAFGPKGEFYALLDGVLHRVDLETGRTTAIATPGLAKAGALAVNAAGDIAVMDLGIDQQVKIFSPRGVLVSTVGKKGGRPIRGVFEPQALSHVRSIAFDGRGDLWAVENWDFPRRVSVWGKDGRLIRDYIGNTGYSGAGTYLHADDPSLAYMGAVEMKLDRTKHEATVTRILWKADETREDEPKTFDIQPLSNAVGQRFRSAASSRLREYLFKQPVYPIPETPAVLFMEDEDGLWRPVAAAGIVGHLSGDVGSKGREVIEPPHGEFAGLSSWDGFFWNDENEDGRVQRSECIIVPSGHPSKRGSRQPQSPVLTVSASWNNTMDPRDLSWLTMGISRISPLRFTAKGAPVYGPESIRQEVDASRLNFAEALRMNPVLTQNQERLVAIQTLNAAGQSPAFVGWDKKTEELVWTYPNRYPGVHGSHKAPMPKEGLLIGPLKSLGTAVLNEEIGEIIALRGNLGQDFFFTTDGLNVGSLFRDYRYPTQPLPPREEDIRGKSMASFSEGSEPFSGWFGKQADGKVRMTTSIARQASLVVEIKGLDTIRRFQGPATTVTAADLEKAAATRPAIAEKFAPQEPWKIKKVAAPLSLKGAEGAWNDIPALTIAKEGAPERAQVQLAHDGLTLYLRAQVTDASPMKNGGKDITRLFKTGDAVDLQLGPSGEGRKEPSADDSRLLLSFFDGRPVAVLMRPVQPDVNTTFARTYASPVGAKHFDRVEKLGSVRLSAQEAPGGYILSAAIPLSVIGISAESGATLGGDIGFISSDATGGVNVARTYWANPNTALVSDEPQEAWFSPASWGEFIFE